MIPSGKILSAVRLERLAKRAAVMTIATTLCLVLMPSGQTFAQAKQAAKKQASKTEKTTPAGKSAPTPVATKGKPMVVDFSAVWCGPCKRFAPTFDKVAKQFADKADFQHIDVDQNPQYADYYKVTAVPATIILDAKGTVKYSHQGIITEEDLVKEVTKVTSGQ